MTDTEKLEINDENFHEYFRDVRTAKPERGDVIARFRATAELVDGNEKQNIMDLLMKTDKAVAASQVMRKLFNACERDSYRVPKEMCQDLLEIGYNKTLEKPYKFTLELFFYTKKEFFPEDNPHWSLISLMNTDQFIEKTTEMEIEDGSTKSDSA